VTVAPPGRCIRRWAACGDLRRQITALARRWETSGETQAVAAARHGVTQAKFRHWVSRVTFSPVQIRDAPGPGPRGGDIELALPTGVWIVIRAAASVTLVHAVVAA
jgi:hypothetical protein